MPHEVMTEQQVAAYLSMPLREILRYASREQIPCRKVGDEKFRFRKSDVDHWVWERMHNFDRKQLAGIDKGVSVYHGFDPDSPLVCPLIPDEGLALPLSAKTRDSALRNLVDLAETCGLVYNAPDLLEQLKDRELLCSTALLPGVAFPHPRHPLPYDIAESFVIVGLNDRGIPFGAEDGSLTRLFFLVCAKDDRTHLHLLARLVRMLDDSNMLEALMNAESPSQLAETLARRELDVLQRG